MQLSTHALNSMVVAAIQTRERMSNYIRIEKDVITYPCHNIS